MSSREIVANGSNASNDSTKCPRKTKNWVWYIWGKLKGRVEGMDERKKKMEDGEGKEDIYEREIYSV